MKISESNDSIKSLVYYKLFVEYIGSHNDIALQYADSSLLYALKIGDSLSIVKSYHARGDMKMETGDVKSGIHDMEKALDISRRNGFNRREMFLLNNLALAYTFIANYDVALDYNFKALKIREDEGDKKAISISYNNIGLVYFELRDYENALFYFLKSNDLAVASGDLSGLEINLTNIGYCYSELGDNDRAVESYVEAYQVCKQDCKKDMLVTIKSALGVGYLKSGRLKDAEEELLFSVSLAKEIGSVRYECIGLRSLAKLRLVEEKFIEALEFLNRSQFLALETDLKTELLENYGTFALIYREMSNYEKAAEYQERYIDLNKSIYSGELIQKISRITTDYEERENIKTIAAKDQVLALQDEIIARQKQQYAFIITITFLTLGLAFVMYRANQSQRKINQELAKAKETIQRQNEMLSDANLQLESEVEERTRELVESNESLVKVNDELDNFIYKTSHDIRGPLASLKGICNVAMMDVKDKAALDYLSKLDTSAAKLNAILSRLLIINQINHSILTPEKINFEEQVEEILELERKKELPERIDISYSIAPGLNFRSDKEMAKIILENLIDNAIKYHNDSKRVDPFVRIEIGKEGDWVSVKVIDNGIGIDDDSKDKIFQLFVRASERSDSGGIGLYLSKLATLKLGGDIYLSKSEEGYTVFRVLFPPDLTPVIERRKEEELRREKQKQKVLKVT